jgi:hypothetical protein
MNYSANYTKRRNNHTRKYSTYKQNGGASLPKYANTFHGLHCWYEAKFEKLGWMVIAKEKGYDYKVESYKLSLDDLLKSIEHVMDEYEDNDRKHDLQVLHDNVKCLQDFVARTL